MSYELHPETPVQGVPLAKRFSGPGVERLFEYIRQRGAEFGLEFNRLTLLSNSRFALEASEYARDLGKFDAFHERMFKAYFTDLLDIGRLDVISAIAEDCDVDAEGMRKALQEGRYLQRLADVRDEAERCFISGVPTFIVNGRHQIIGAQPRDVFVDLFRKLASPVTPS